MAQFKWNTGNHTVNETNTYPLNNDPSNLSTLDFELDTYGTLTIEAYIDDQGRYNVKFKFDESALDTFGTLTIEAYTDDQGWPTPHRTSIRWAVKPPHSIRGSRNARIAHSGADENGQRQLRLPDRC